MDDLKLEEFRGDIACCLKCLIENDSVDSAAKFFEYWKITKNILEEELTKHVNYEIKHDLAALRGVDQTKVI